MDFVVWFSIRICWLLFCLPLCSSKKEIIGSVLDKSIQSRTLNGKGAVWVFEPVQSSVHTCGTGSTADFWFVTKHVDLSSSYADVIYVDVEAEFRLCDDPGRNNPVPCASNYYEVYIHRGKLELIVKSATIDDLLGVFSLVHNITNSTLPSGTRFKQTFFFNPNDTKGVTFAVRSRGTCGDIFNMTMYYYHCEETFVNSVKLMKTPSPMSGFKLVTANCSKNSRASSNLTRLEGRCYNNGSWNMNNDFKCLCIEGYEPNEKRGCSLCKPDSFKQQVSNSKCSKCPLRRISSKNRTSCRCGDGFYKSPWDVNNTSPCYALLVLSKSPEIEYNKTSVTIKWTSPNPTESLHEAIVYDVECFSCEDKNDKMCKLSCGKVMFYPRQENLDTTSVVATNLQPGESYLFRVYPKNSLNDMIPKEDWKFLETGLFTYQQSKPPSSTKGESDPIGSIVIAVIAVVLFVLIVALLIFAFRRRGSKNKPLRTFLNNGVDLPSAGQKPYVDPTNYSNVEEAVEELANELDPRSIFLEKLIGGGEFGDVYKGELTRSNGKKIPVAVKTLKRDASSKSSRDFMLEASVMAQFDNPNVVKMEGVITRTTRRMIVIEYMSNGSLDNYLKSIAGIIYSYKSYIISTEDDPGSRIGSFAEIISTWYFLQNKSYYLKSNDGMLTRLQLLGMARDVASGMNYFTEIKFVHRDLAARNVLVNDATLCKISDFGLTREVETTETQSLGEYATTGGKIPIRWTAPEAIKFRKFTTASDVWSFGILLWEIMSFSQRPYWEWDNFKVLEEVDNGFRLPPPPISRFVPCLCCDEFGSLNTKCPFGVHSLMLQCWKADRGERPSFAQIVVVIDRWIRSPETMDDEANFFITIGDWLTSIKMGNYKTMFIEAGYTKQSDIIDLTEHDLKNVGVTLIGHRNKIMKGIETLRARKTRNATPLLPRSTSF